MRTFIGSLIFGLLILALPVSGKDKKNTAIPPDVSNLMQVRKDFLKTVKFYPGGKVAINTGFMGSVTVTGWSRSEVRIQAETTAWGETSEAMLANVQVIKPHITRTDSDVTITTEHPKEFTLGRIDYRVNVPAYRTDLDIRSNIGSITLRDINGWAEATTLTGYLSLVRLSGYLSAKTRTGDILAQLKGNRWEGLQISAVTEKGDVKVYMPIDYSTDLSLIAVIGMVEVTYPLFPTQDDQMVPIAVTLKKGGAYATQQVRQGGTTVVFQTGNGLVRLLGYDPATEYLDESPAPDPPPQPKQGEQP